MTKYGAIKTEVDGIRFASKREAARYRELKLLERAGAIVGLQLQPSYPLVINGMNCGRYVGDFAYLENRRLVIEDSKGFRTPVYRLKRKLMKAIHGIDIREV